MVTAEKIKEIKQHTGPIFKQYGVVRSSLVGSMARGEEKEESDIDILIELREPLGLFKFSALQYKLQDALKRKVDLITYRSVSPKLKEFFKKDEVSLL